ncbi:MAG: hypothetical protein ACE141_10835 [Bryobacteraceae bacterium]
MKRLFLLILTACAVVAAQPVCSVLTVRGTYAVSYDGWALMPQPGSPLPLAVPGVILGVVSIGHDGKLSGAETVIIGGQATEYDIAGSIDIKPDCTGTLRTFTKLRGSADKPSPVTERFVVLVKGTWGEEVDIRTTIVEMPGSLVGAMGLGIWRRMTSMPGSANW